MIPKVNYIKLEQAAKAQGDGYSLNHLIHLGANGLLPIYVIASEWEVKAKHWQIHTVPDEDGYLHEELASRNPDGIYLEQLNGLFPLHKKTIQKFEHDTNAKLLHFYVQTTDDGGNPQFSDYRFNPEVNSDKLGDLVITVSSLFVMTDDVNRLTSPPQISTDEVADAGYIKPKRKAPDAFVAALIRLLVDIAVRAAKNDMPFDVTAMPGTKQNLQELAEKIDPEFKHTPKTFDDYLAGLCQFKQGAKSTDFYIKLFPELPVKSKTTGET